MNDPSRNSFWLGVDLAQHTFDASRASGAAPLEDNDKARIHCLVAVMRKLLEE